MKRFLALVMMSMLFALNSFALETQSIDDNIYHIKDIEGKSYTVEALPNGLDFKELKGKVVFLEFFGHRCPPCLKSIPKYIKLQKKYKDQLAIVAIEVQGLSSEQAKAFAKEKGINYITISQIDAGMLTEHIATRASWSGAIPFLIILDQKGAVQTMQAGLIPEDALANVIEELTKEATDKKPSVSVKESNATAKQ